MTAFLADGTSATLVWTVAGIGIVALSAAVVVSLSSRRARRSAPTDRSGREEGSALEAIQPTPSPPSDVWPDAAEPEAQGAGGEVRAEPNGAPAAAEIKGAPEPTPSPPLAPGWLAVWAAPPVEVAGEPRALGTADRAVDTGPGPAGALEPPSAGPLGAAPPANPLPSVDGDVNLRGILRWLLFETDADATVFHRSTPMGEEFYIEPRGLPDDAVAGLARRAREAMAASRSGDRAGADAPSVRWLGVGGSKLLLLDGASPDDAAEPLRFARFAIESLAASRSGMRPPPSEELARTVPGVAWAEMMTDGRLRVLPTDTEGAVLTSEALAEVLPGQLLRWIIAPSQEIEERPRLLEVNLSEGEGGPSAEVRLFWRGSERQGVGRGQTSLAGRHLATARAAIEALKPLVRGDMHVEHLQVSTLRSDAEAVMVSVLVGEERLVGATVVRAEDEERAGAKAVLDAVNRRLVMISGRSGRI
jgi:heme exporter protein D